MSVYDAGDVWSQIFYVRDSTGALANAGAVTATLTLPDGTTASPTVVNSSTGTYTVTYSTALTQTGRYNIYVQATGTNACALSDQFDVRSFRGILSIADARATLNFPTSYTQDDEELRDYIDAVTDLIENEIGPVTSRTVTEDVEIWRDQFMVTQPITSLTSLTPIRTGGIALAAADFQVMSTGRVVRKDGACIVASPWNLYTIVYVSSQTAAPRILQAARLLLKHLWRTQRGAGTRPGQGDDDTFNIDAIIWNQVLGLLHNDMQTGIG